MKMIVSQIIKAKKERRFNFQLFIFLAAKQVQVNDTQQLIN